MNRADKGISVSFNGHRTREAHVTHIYSNDKKSCFLGDHLTFILSSVLKSDENILIFLSDPAVQKLKIINIYFIHHYKI